MSVSHILFKAKPETKKAETKQKRIKKSCSWIRLRKQLNMGANK